MKEHMKYLVGTPDSDTWHNLLETDLQHKSDVTIILPAHMDPQEMN